MPKNFNLPLPKNFNGCINGEWIMSKDEYEKITKYSKGFLELTPELLRRTDEHLGLPARSDEERQIAVNVILER